MRVIVATLIAAVIGYQTWLWIEVDEIERRAYAILNETVPRVGTQEHIELRSRWEQLLGDVQELRRTHPVQLASIRLVPKYEVWVGAWQELEHDAEVHVRGLYEQARRAELRGSFDEARQIYRELDRVSGDRHWGESARVKLIELEGVTAASTEIRRLGDAARARGDQEQAFRLLRDLLDRFPSAEASAGVTLPVRVVSTPPGAQVSLGPEEDPLGSTPLVLDLVPFTPVELWVSHPDHEPMTVTIEDPREPAVHVDLGEAIRTDAPPAPPEDRTPPWSPQWLFLNPRVPE